MARNTAVLIACLSLLTACATSSDVDAGSRNSDAEYALIGLEIAAGEQHARPMLLTQLGEPAVLEVGMEDEGAMRVSVTVAASPRPNLYELSLSYEDPDTPRTLFSDTLASDDETAFEVVNGGEPGQIRVRLGIAADPEEARELGERWMASAP